MNLKFGFHIVLFTFGFNHFTFAQFNPEKPNLRQSGFFTLDEAKNEHENMAMAYADAESWKKKAQQIKQGILEGAEITQFKAGKKVNAVIHSRKIMNGYSVENVFFESIKGTYVTGNLYKPLNIKGKIPGILAPHGHGDNLRLGEATQQRCATMAKMGAIVFAFDMIGHGDMQQCNHKIEKALKLQLINSIRVLDFLSQMPNVDTSRIAISGESGGGTQSFLLAAIDDRIKVSVPVVMVSGYFFGGCTCESGMPIHVRPQYKTSNVEIAACIAPKPLLLVSDGDDWTKNTPEFEYPFIKRIYGFYNAESNIENAHLPLEKHDYGFSKRKAVYIFLAKHLKLDISKADEIGNELLSKEKLSVFNDKIHLPKNALKGDIAIMDKLNKIK
jgi:uncharacterized protein